MTNRRYSRGENNKSFYWRKYDNTWNEHDWNGHRTWNEHDWNERNRNERDRNERDRNERDNKYEGIDNYRGSDEMKSRVDRNQLINIVPLYADITVYASATRGCIKRRKSKANYGYIETVVLANVSFDGICFDHIWVLLNDNLRCIPFGAKIEFKARTYQYKRRDGSYSLGLRKIDSVKIKNFISLDDSILVGDPSLSSVNRWQSIKSFPPCRSESVLQVSDGRYSVNQL